MIFVQKIETFLYIRKILLNLLLVSRKVTILNKLHFFHIKADYFHEK